MQAFFESMNTRILWIPFWVWLVAIFIVCWYFGQFEDARPVFDAGGGACGAFGGGLAC